MLWLEWFEFFVVLIVVEFLDLFWGCVIEDFKGVVDWLFEGEIKVLFGLCCDLRYGMRVLYNGIWIVCEIVVICVVFFGKVCYVVLFKGFGEMVIL